MGIFSYAYAKIRLIAQTREKKWKSDENKSGRKKFTNIETQGWNQSPIDITHHM